jgi:hypothetical protein
MALVTESLGCFSAPQGLKVGHTEPFYLGREVRRDALPSGLRPWAEPWVNPGKPWAMLYWPLRAKDLPSGNLKMSKPQGPMAMTKIAFRP